MWSVGCIMYELLKMVKADKHTSNDSGRHVLFKGDSCFPLSPLKNNREQADVNYISDNDQLKVIIQKTG